MVALSARTGGSRHTGLAALPHENNQFVQMQDYHQLQTVSSTTLRTGNLLPRKQSKS